MHRWPGNARQERTSFGSLSRSELMSRVRSAGNVTTELKAMALLRRFHLSGWRRHAHCLGNPDFVWRAQKVALFVDGCYWHGHHCGRNMSPKTNAKSWQAKFRRNRSRDRAVTRELRALGWSVVRVWECELRREPLQCARRIKLALHDRGTRKRRKIPAQRGSAVIGAVSPGKPRHFRQRHPAPTLGSH
jgi:DNA mismatch endonuclease (patch repair protein)